MASSPPARLVRTLKLAVVIALAAALLPLAPARASHVTARDVADACRDAPEDGFTDTGPEGSVGEEAVDCIAWYGITTGTSATTYSPGLTITRAQMATMIAASMRQSEKNFAEPSASEDFFDDDDGSVHERNINFVAKHRVVQGISSRRFAPNHNVLRDQMATFIANQLTAIGADVPVPSQDYFSDDETSVHERNINALAGLGIVTGRLHGLYDPRSSVTRGQMAFFITRDLDYLVEEDLMLLPVDEAIAGEHTSVDVVSVNRAGDFFLGNTDTQNHGLERFRYDAGDTFEVAGFPSATTIDMVRFEGLLTGPSGDTAGDVIDIDYQPGGNSTFTVATDNIPLTAPVATVVNLDNGSTINDVFLSWTGGQPDVTYDVFRDNTTLPPGGNGTAGPEDTAVAEGLTATSVTLDDEPDGTRVYIVEATSAGSGTSVEKASNSVTVPGTAVSAGSPRSENAVLTQDVNAAGSQPFAGDTWRFALDKPLAPLEDGDALLMGGAGGPYTITNGSTGDFSLNTGTVNVAGKDYGPGQVLTVQLNAPLGASASYPLSVVTSNGLATAGNDLPNWDGSYDVSIQDDTTRPVAQDHDEDSPPPAVCFSDHDPDGAAGTDNKVSAGDEIMVTFSELMAGETPQRPVLEQVVIRDFDGHTATLTNNGTSATFEYTDGTGPDHTVLTITVEATPSQSVEYNRQPRVQSNVYVIDLAGQHWNTSPNSVTQETQHDALNVRACSQNN